MTKNFHSYDLFLEIYVILSFSFTIKPLPCFCCISYTLLALFMTIMTPEKHVQVAIGYDEGSVIIKLGREEPAVSMDIGGKILWAKHSEIQQVPVINCLKIFLYF